MKLLPIITASALTLALTACGGGSSSPAIPTAPSNPASNAKMIPTSFTISVPKKSGASSSRRAPQYVGAGVVSVTIVLNTVNGGAPPAGLTTSVTSNVTAPCAPCTVAGPSVPPGSDAFTLTTYDGTGGTGNAISVATPTLTIAAGVANSNTITLDGVPASFSITGLPGGTAGTAFGSPAAFGVAVQDADGNTITGTYASPVTISDSDITSLTQGSALAVNGGSAASFVVSTASTDTFTFNYGGLAIVPATITASAPGATSGTSVFAPTLQSIVYTPGVGANASGQEVDFYATSGTGSTAAFTASEVGWTNAPYSKTLTLTPAGGCANILNGSTSTLTGTSFTENVAAAPAVGSCTATLTDGVGAHALAAPITFTYTTSGIGVN
jgi:hypothetical protein